MKRIFLVMLVSLLFSYIGHTQSPVTWSFDSKKMSDDVYEIKITAIIEDEWHVYSQITPKGGPVPTSISFTKNPLVVLDGLTKETGSLEQHFEPLFGVDVKQYSGKVSFTQLVKLKAKVKLLLNGSVNFMTCNDRECLPPATQKFSIALK